MKGDRRGGIEHMLMSFHQNEPQLIIRSRDPRKAMAAVEAAPRRTVIVYRGVQIYSHVGVLADYFTAITMLAYLPSSIVRLINFMDFDASGEADILVVFIAAGAWTEANAARVVEHLASAGQVIGHGTIVPVAGDTPFHKLIIPPHSAEPSDEPCDVVWSHKAPLQ